MPPKTKKSQPKPKEKRLAYPMAIRFEEGVLARVDGFVAGLRKRVGASWRIKRTDAIRTLVAMGLRCAEANHDGGAPDAVKRRGPSVCRRAGSLPAPSFVARPAG